MFSNQNISLKSEISKNIVLIGMPGCGKTTIGKKLAELTERDFFDSDEIIEAKHNRAASEILKNVGEEKFRALETDALKSVEDKTNSIIATGGGCVTRSRNYSLLHKNGIVIWLQRDINKLQIAGRPISMSRSIHEIYAERRGLYESFADMKASNDLSITETAVSIIEMLNR